MKENNEWTENVIIADGDFIDDVAFDLTVNFERMLGRRIPQADTARWAECIALDGGLREGHHETTVVLIHDAAKRKMANFAPGNYADELNRKAFSGRLGEFSFTAVTTEGLASKESLFADTLQIVLQQKEVKRLMVIPNEACLDRVRQTLRRADDEKRITVFAMQPIAGGDFRQEILGYSLMAALGIKGNEIKPEE